MVGVLNGGTAMACLAIGIYFLRFWRESRDRLFVCLAAAFGTFALNYAVLGVLSVSDERRALAFVLRLAGFVAILVGLLLKDRELSEHLRQPRDREPV